MDLANFDLLIGEAAQFGVELNQGHLEAFRLYAAELATWNEKISLTAIRDGDGVRQKHFLDSLSCYSALLGTPVKKVIDVGSGAGFPGLPLKVIFPEMELTLVESVAKKTRFLSHIVQELGLEGVQILTQRAEKVGHMTEHRGAYDWGIARAVAPLPVISEYLLPLVKVGGKMLAQKGGNAREETESAQSAFKELGGELEEIIPVMIPGVDEERNLVVVSKIIPTSEKYPRREGIPAKRPL